MARHASTSLTLRPANALLLRYARRLNRAEANRQGAREAPRKQPVRSMRCRGSRARRTVPGQANMPSSVEGSIDRGERYRDASDWWISASMRLNIFVLEQS